MDCDKVDRSVYSEILACRWRFWNYFYVSIFVLALIKFLRPVMGATEDFTKKRFYLSAIGLLLLYLNFVEAFYQKFLFGVFNIFCGGNRYFPIVFIGLEKSKPR